jgi:hypothetical protein
VFMYISISSYFDPCCGGCRRFFVLCSFSSVTSHSGLLSVVRNFQCSLLRHALINIVFVAFLFLILFYFFFILFYFY